MTTQYRMHEKIMTFPSSALYENKLIAADAVKGRLLKDLPYDVEDNEEFSDGMWASSAGYATNGLPTFRLPSLQQVRLVASLHTTEIDFFVAYRFPETAYR